MTMNGLILAAGLVALSTPIPAFAGPIETEAQFRSEIVDRVLKGSRGFMSFQAIHRADGTSSVRSSFRNSEGRWEFRNGEVCVAWERMNGGKERCQVITRVGENRYRMANGIEITAE